MHGPTGWTDVAVVGDRPTHAGGLRPVLTRCRGRPVTCADSMVPRWGATPGAGRHRRRRPLLRGPLAGHPRGWRLPVAREALAGYSPIISGQHAVGEAVGHVPAWPRCRRRNARNRSGPTTAAVHTLWRDRTADAAPGAEGARSATSPGASKLSGKRTEGLASPMPPRHRRATDVLP